MQRRYEMIASDDLATALAGARRPVLIDVRERDDFLAARLPGSRHLPVHTMGERRSALPSSLAERLIVVADDELQAHAAGNFLSLIGFGDVAVLDGGISMWTGALEHGPPASEPGTGPALRVVP